MNFTGQHKKVAIISVLTLFIMQIGCADGFKSARMKTGGTPGTGGVLPTGDGVTPDAELEEIVITAERIVPPRIESLVKAAKDSEITVHFENIGEKDADVILTTEVESLENNTIKIKSLINISGEVSLISGEAVLADNLDGQATVVSVDFDKDFKSIGEMRNVNGARFAQQTILYCENKCGEITVHVQLTDADQKLGAAFYNYRKNEKNEYVLVNSSVESRYQTISQVVEALKAQGLKQ